MCEEKKRVGRPVEHPNSPLHIYWRQRKRAQREREEGTPS